MIWSLLQSPKVQEPAAQSNKKVVTENAGGAKAPGHLIKPHLCILVIRVIVQNVNHAHSPHTRILS